MKKSIPIEQKRKKKFTRKRKRRTFKTKRRKSPIKGSYSL